MNSHQSRLLNQIRTTWEHHPKWSLGKLIQSANNIALGEIRSNPAYARDGQLIIGLKALIPEQDEVAAS